MNTTAPNAAALCTCANCPGAGCQCGCQTGAISAAAACKCGDACRCDGPEQGCLCQ